ncbi:hypothetical protein BV898_16239 [Hypsibius exemplaris]|uniref:EGF-like domain-containing protein n=1 Tax=Hypsibius exemplaris TaxID=2072580 RepID=A0A9X6RLE4_HYPEX|nr:hypothetical protein BV898_16239 [Hypsibius exemplaris]
MLRLTGRFAVLFCLCLTSIQKNGVDCEEANQASSSPTLHDLEMNDLVVPVAGDSEGGGLGVTTTGVSVTAEEGTQTGMPVNHAVGDYERAEPSPPDGTPFYFTSIGEDVDGSGFAAPHIYEWSTSASIISIPSAIQDNDSHPAQTTLQPGNNPTNHSSALADSFQIPVLRIDLQTTNASDSDRDFDSTDWSLPDTNDANLTSTPASVTRETIPDFNGTDSLDRRVEVLPESGSDNEQTVTNSQAELIEFDDCPEGQHNCDLATTQCVYWMLAGNFSCECLAFHVRHDEWSCRFDHRAALAYLDATERRRTLLWIGIYALIGLFALAMIALTIALILLKTRPTKSTKIRSGKRHAKMSVSRYENKLPRPTLNSTATNGHLQDAHPAMENTLQSNEIPAAPSGEVNTNGIQPNRYSGQASRPVAPAPAPPVPFSTTTLTHQSVRPRSISPQIVIAPPYEMSTFQRGQRLSQPLTITNAKVHPDYFQSPARVPLASPESSTEGLNVIGRNSSSSSNTTPFRDQLEAHRLVLTGRALPEGTIYPMSNAAAVQEAVQQHRHSALLNLSQSHNHQNNPSYYELSHV